MAIFDNNPLSALTNPVATVEYLSIPSFYTNGRITESGQPTKCGLR